MSSSSSGRKKQQPTLASFFAPKGVGGLKPTPKTKPKAKAKAEAKPKLNPKQELKIDRAGIPTEEEEHGTEDKKKIRSTTNKNAVKPKLAGEEDETKDKKKIRSTANTISFKPKLTGAAEEDDGTEDKKKIRSTTNTISFKPKLTGAAEEEDGTEDKKKTRSSTNKTAVKPKLTEAAERNVKDENDTVKPTGGSQKDDEKVAHRSKATRTKATKSKSEPKEEKDLVDTDDESNVSHSKDGERRRKPATKITSKKHQLKSRAKNTRLKKIKRIVDDDDGGDSLSEEIVGGENSESEYDGEVEDEDEEEEEDEDGAEDVSDNDLDSLMKDTDDDDDDDDDEMDDTLQSLAQDSKKKSSKIRSKPSSKGDKSINSAIKYRSNTPKLSKASSKKKSPTLLTDDQLLENDQSKWAKDGSVPYSVLCSTLSDIEAISSRLEIQRHLTCLFRRCLLKSPKDMLTLVYLASNSVAAAYECVELGVGDAILIKAIGEANGSNPSIIRQKYVAEGDLGTVAMTSKGKQRTLGFGVKPKPLMVQETLAVFREIATTTGALSQKWKVDKIKGLLVRAQEVVEAKYIIRGLQGKLRIGLAQSTVLVSLAHAVTLSCPIKDDKEIDGTDDTQLSQDSLKVKNLKNPIETRLESAVNIVKKAYSEVSSFDALVDALVLYPLYMINIKCSLRPGLPVEPMLAKPTKSVQEVLKRLNGKRFTCEYKYDGERAQVHMSPNGTKVFSRSLLDTSEKYPEVPLYVKEACVSSNVTSFVLDTEVVAYNRETKQFVPFQILSTRKKTGESDDNAKVKVIVQAFDLMFLNGRSLLDLTLLERRSLLRENFSPVEQKFQYATALDHTEDGDTTLLEEFLETAVKSQCEGLMVKTLEENATYQPSYRSLNWLKLKKDYLEGMGDSLDLVPLGAYFGQGKRTGVYGAYLLACYDVDTEEYQSVCKIGTGFSDEVLQSLPKLLNTKVIPQKSSQYNVSKSLECDVWFETCQVWEVKAADLSKSSTHKGAVDKTGETGRGIGLRFPRFERLRDDKKPEQATTSDQILEMYYAQDSVISERDGYDDDGI